MKFSNATTLSIVAGVASAEVCGDMAKVIHEKVLSFSGIDLNDFTGRITGDSGICGSLRALGDCGGWVDFHNNRRVGIPPEQWVDVSSDCVSLFPPPSCLWWPFLLTDLVGDGV